MKPIKISKPVTELTEPLIIRKIQRNSKELTTEQLDSMGFNPVQQSVAIAKGEALTQDHPFLALLNAWSVECQEIVDNEPHRLGEMLDNIVRASEKWLKDTWVSHDLRSKHTLALQQVRI